MHREKLPNGTWASVRNGYTMQDGTFRPVPHGAHTEEHRQEMRHEAIKAIYDYVPPMIEAACIKICTETVENIMGAIEWDINEVINVSFDDVGKVFHSEKFRKVISDKIMESIKKNLKNIEIQ